MLLVRSQLYHESYNFTNPARIKINVAEGAAASSSTGERNRRSTKRNPFPPSRVKRIYLALYFPLDEAENATTVQDWGPHGLVGTVSGNPAVFPAESVLHFDFRKHRAWYCG